MWALLTVSQGFNETLGEFRLETLRVEATGLQFLLEIRHLPIYADVMDDAPPSACLCRRPVVLVQALLLSQGPLSLAGFGRSSRAG